MHRKIVERNELIRQIGSYSEQSWDSGRCKYSGQGGVLRKRWDFQYKIFRGVVVRAVYALVREEESLWENE